MRFPHRLIERAMLSLVLLISISVLVLALINLRDPVDIREPLVGMRPSNEVRCYEFPSQAAAQRFFREHPTARQLDADHDGVACEDNRVPKDMTPIAR